MRIIILCFLLSGCAIIPPHAINIDIKGKNLETPYGKIEDGEIHVHSAWGQKCEVKTSATDTNSGSAPNPAK